MYTSFFGLNERPFSIAPDPRFLFMSERHTEALAHLIYGVTESGGFIQLTGEVGTGKTTLVRSLLQQLPDTTDVALILNPQLSRNEFLSTICEELEVPLPDSANSIKTLINALNKYLLNNHSKSRRTVLIVDEAQNLRLDVLEQVRLLTNLETTRQKLLQITLIGQPELRELLSRTDMRQLAQRITGRYHLEPLSREETEAYIDHRLKVAGGVGKIFTKASKRELYRLSGGVPRRINVIADRALLGAFTQEIRQIDPKLLRRAAAEVLGQHRSRFSPWRRWLKAGVIAIAVVAIAAGVGWGWTERSRLSFPEPALLAPTAADATAEISATVPVRPVPPTLDEPAPGGDQPPPAAAEPHALATGRLESLLQTHADVTTTADAFDTLFRFWGASYDFRVSSACAQAEQLKLDCLKQSGSLAQVRSLDRPVILTLRGYGGRQHKIVLSGLNDEFATISIASQDYRISPDELNEFWFGEYLLLWRPEFEQLTMFSPGMQGEAVIWLRESLAEIQGEPVSPPDSDFFDSELEARVRSYQRDKRLGVDGVVGYHTQIAINSDLGLVNRPRLTRMN